MTALFTPSTEPGRQHVPTSGVKDLRDLLAQIPAVRSGEIFVKVDVDANRGLVFLFLGHTGVCSFATVPTLAELMRAVTNMRRANRTQRARTSRQIHAEGAE